MIKQQKYFDKMIWYMICCSKNNYYDVKSYYKSGKYPECSAVWRWRDVSTKQKIFYWYELGPKIISATPPGQKFGQKPFNMEICLAWKFSTNTERCFLHQDRIISLNASLQPLFLFLESAFKELDKIIKKNNNG